MSQECTCGAKTVSSRLHSAWCDCLKKPSSGVVSYFQQATRGSTEYLYVVPYYKDATYTFERFKDALKDNWLMTTLLGNLGSITLKNRSDILFINPTQIKEVRGRIFDVLFVEQCDEVKDILLELQPFLFNGPIVLRVDPDTQEILP